MSVLQPAPRDDEGQGPNQQKGETAHGDQDPAQGDALGRPIAVECRVVPGEQARP